MYVTKNGMVHKCDTEERYRSFISSGWEPYSPEPKKDAPQKAVKKTAKK